MSDRDYVKHCRTDNIKHQDGLNYWKHLYLQPDAYSTTFVLLWITLNFENDIHLNNLLWISFIIIGARFNNIQVMIGGKECATFKGPGEKGEIIPLRCSHPLTGKKVEVLLKGNGILSFAEIKIIAAEGKY